MSKAMMTFETTTALIFAGTFFATALSVWPFRCLALRMGLVDRPDNFRKLHKQPIPVGGGFVIFLVMTVLMVVLINFQDQIGFKLRLSPKLLLPLMLVSPFVVVVGLIDDKQGLNGKVKLLIQVIAASIIVAFAKYYSTVSFFGIDLDLHHLFYPLAVLWIVGTINAVNLLDGADGVVVTVGFFMSLATACIATINGHPGIALICIGLAGCLLGFFIHNRPLAKIYLGDTGSMFIGLALATLLLRASVGSGRTISMCGPLAIVLIPAIDVFCTAIRRINSGRTIFVPDRGHIHHLLLKKVHSPYRVLAILNLLILPGCIAAVVGVYYRNDYIPLAVSAIVLIIAVGTDLFGRQELSILLGRIKSRFRKWFHKTKYMAKNGEVYHIQGSGPWRNIWDCLVAILHDYPCKRLQLDINMPNRNEDFFGEWENVSQNAMSQPLTCSLTLAVDETQVGILSLVFENQHYDRDVLLALASQLSSFCETLITRYLKSDKQGEVFVSLPLDSVTTISADETFVADTSPKAA